MIQLNCPVPHHPTQSIQMAHGGGGRLMNQLIRDVFQSSFNPTNQQSLHDSSVLGFGNGKLALTTDSYVVNPLFFPGGDIGSLAVNGTVNDLLMSGARPLYMTVGMILEEGFSIDQLRQIVGSMQSAAVHAGVEIVAGDTKVVEKGKGDGIYINTAGVGIIEYPCIIHPSSVCPGDVILLSGDIGSHGMAIMAAREGFEFDSQIVSDCAALIEPVMRLLEGGIEVHCLRDLTRGGMAAALNEIALDTGFTMRIDETKIPVNDNVAAACELLGLDPLYVANEGRFIAFIPSSQADKALAILHQNSLSQRATVAGIVEQHGKSPLVVMKTILGTSRVVDMLSGEQLPRIC